MWRGNADDGFFQDMPAEDFYPYLTLVLGLRKNQTTLDWCSDCLTRIRNRKQ